ncbi:hypothetical protein BAOM_2959 [Peribacillus asahii]|uniref:Uncharacterized protein n=1 Tax=Peribacillus asahii TaxID=228899 RepID=A0A3Q9RP65_9BACI|nr:hypothetical protein [Peribacillus asahii]AZV43568.1 hypothetical protein BAOM_2959 [Peribacillus asahii]
MFCGLCEETGDRSHVITLTDKVSRVEIKGCKNCIDDVWIKIRQIEGRDKMSNEKVLELLGLSIDDFEVEQLRK